MRIRIAMRMAVFMCMHTITLMRSCTMLTVRMNIRMTARCITGTARRARMRRE